MKYRVIHKTEYTYEEPVPLCHNIMHLRPRDFDRQRCFSCAIDIAPLPASRNERLDFFGNHVTYFTLQEPHRALALSSRCEVEVQPLQLPAKVESPAWEAVVQTLKTRIDRETLALRQFTFASPRVPVMSELAELAKQSFLPEKSIFEAATDLNRQINKQFKYDPSATSVGTSVAEVLEHRRGVCQDFAHLLIGSLRSIGLAARYVSGYLLTLPPPGKPRLVGADSSHAWVSIFIPTLGWLDMDPTNGMLPSDEHITVAWARDYDDVCPVKGVILGGRQHTLKVSVDVEMKLMAEPSGRPPSPPPVQPAPPPTGSPEPPR